MAKVLVLMGSKSDLDAVKPAVTVLRQFGVDTDVKVLSAHRTPDEVAAYARGEHGKYDVFIAAAGKAAHLGGVIAAYTVAPVIGLPIKSSTLDGLDSLLSMVQMPNGVPVACVAIGGGLNAGLLALQIIGVSDKAVREKLVEYKKRMAEEVIAANKGLDDSFM